MKYLHGILAAINLTFTSICIATLFLAIINSKAPQWVIPTALGGTIWFGLTFISCVNAWDKADRHIIHHL